MPCPIPQFHHRQADGTGPPKARMSSRTSGISAKALRCLAHPPHGWQFLPPICPDLRPRIDACHRSRRHARRHRLPRVAVLGLPTGRDQRECPLTLRCGRSDTGRGGSEMESALPGLRQHRNEQRRHPDIDGGTVVRRPITDQPIRLPRSRRDDPRQRQRGLTTIGPADPRQRLARPIQYGRNNSERSPPIEYDSLYSRGRITMHATMIGHIRAFRRVCPSNGVTRFDSVTFVRR